MRSSRLLPLAVALVAAAHAAPATPAAAAGLKARAYTVTFDGTVKTEWTVPRWRQYQTCFTTTWIEGRGEETWNVRSRGVNKVLAYSNGVATQLQFGSWERNADTRQTGVLGKGEIHRSGGYTTSFTAGSCGIDPHEDPQFPTGDCGTRLVNYAINLVLARGEVTPEVLPDDNGIREKITFDSCTLETPDNMLAGNWPAVSAKLPDKQLLRATKAFTIKGQERWPGPIDHGTASTTIDWKATFTPAKPPKKKAGRR